MEIIHSRTIVEFIAVQLYNCATHSCTIVQSVFSCKNKTLYSPVAVLWSATFSACTRWPARVRCRCPHPRPRQSSSRPAATGVQSVRGSSSGSDRPSPVWSPGSACAGLERRAPKQYFENLGKTKIRWINYFPFLLKTSFWWPICQGDQNQIDCKV